MFLRGASLSLACLLAPASAAAQAQPTTVQRPTLQAGLTRTYDTSDGVYVDKLLEEPTQDPDCKLAPCSKWRGTSPKRTTYVYRDADHNMYKRTDMNDKVVYQSTERGLRFPLTIGDSWTSTFVNTNGTPVDEKITVVRWTRLRVLGTDYQALHLHGDGKRGYNRQSPRIEGTTYSTDYYYVPELGVVAKLDYTSGTQGVADYHSVLTKIEK